MFVREFEFSFTTRLWDTLLAVGSMCPIFSLYISASLLKIYTGRILRMNDISELADFTQKLPVRDWDDRNFVQLINGAIDILGQDTERAFHERLAARAETGTMIGGIQGFLKEGHRKEIVLGCVAFAVAVGAAYVFYKMNSSN